MITLREMKFAVTLAKARSFSNAARELYISQPSLSQAIKTLETELAVTLFDRKSATLRLTTAGELFVREATEILAMSDALEKDMRALSQSQTVSFGISPFYGRYYLPGCLPQFKKNHPGVTVNVTECSSNDLEVLLSEKRLILPSFRSRSGTPPWSIPRCCVRRSSLPSRGHCRWNTPRRRTRTAFRG